MVLLGGAYFGQMFALKTNAKIEWNEILVKNYSRCLISISLLYFRKISEKYNMYEKDKININKLITIARYAFVLLLVTPHIIDSSCCHISLCVSSRLFDCQGWWPWLGWFTLDFWEICPPRFYIFFMLLSMSLYFLVHTIDSL